MNAKRTRYFDRRTFLGTAALGAAAFVAPRFAGAQDIRRARPTGVVPITAGRIRGVVLENGVSAFYGVPYGASTAGDGRFMPPKPVPGWTDVRDTMAVTGRSPQDLDGPIPEVYALDRRQPMSEDCLHVNVFTPAAGTGARPVMVWLHGGGFSSGSGDWLLYDGARLAASRDVVVVTVTHRLNVFGYLYLPEIGGEKYAHSTNVGMQDIVLALEWVQHNAAAFGGDPGKVTLFGQSGGGRKVSILTGMPAAKGLFHRAIVMSGSQNTGTSASDATEATRKFMALVGASTADDLQRMPMETLRAAAVKSNFNLQPVLDGVTLLEHPYDPVATAVSANVPLIVGTVEHEATFTRSTPLDPIDDPALRKAVKNETRATDAQVEQLIAIYRKGRPNVENVDLLQILISDNGYRARADVMCDAKVKQGTASVYRYQFNWQSPVREGKLKSFHTLDIPFAFDNVDVAASMTGGGQERYALAEKISTAFATFARSGDPNHSGLPRWPAFNAAERPTMIFDNECRVVNDPHRDERLALAELRKT
ncbi:MAG TPA: carboxylesterase family protein [Gammaproteobacteria bacterium]|nr:carboxylesterase family protein [Gammaproteobacteria bacterium]